MHVQVSGSERIKVHKTPRRASASAGERLRDLIGNPVQSGSGPAAVDPFATILLHATGLFREGRESRGEPEDLPERRFARFGLVERGARGSLRLGAWPAGCDEDEKRYPPPSLHGGGYFSSVRPGAARTARVFFLFRGPGPGNKEDTGMKHMLRKTAALALALCLTVALAGIALGADGGKKGVLLVAFGTSMDTGAPAYEGIEGAFRKTGEPVVWAFTSNIIRAKMAKQGVKLLTVPEGLAKLADEGVTDVTVQSLHIMAGEEYAKMERLVLTDVLAHPDRFASVKVGRPLVESMRDARDVAEAVLHSLPAARSADDAVLLMAHGQGEGRCDMVFAGMKDVVNDTDPLAFMASVEGYQGIDQVLPELQAKGAKRVWLLPFMVVAGDHAHNDLAGDEPDSWASLLKAQGFEVFPVLKGLGENPGVQSVFVRHAMETEDDYAHPVVKTSADE